MEYCWKVLKRVVDSTVAHGIFNDLSRCWGVRSMDAVRDTSGMSICDMSYQAICWGCAGAYIRLRAQTIHSRDSLHLGPLQTEGTYKSSASVL